MKDIHQWLPIVSLLMITISGTLATVSVKGNNGTVLIAKTNNRGNVKINQDTDDFTDMRIQLSNPYPLKYWASKHPAEYQLHHERATLEPSNQPYPFIPWGTNGRATLNPRNQQYRSKYRGSKDPAKYQLPHKNTTVKPRNQPSHTKKPAAASKNVKRTNPTKSHLGVKPTNSDLLNSSRPKYEKLHPISIKNNNGTILVAHKNNRANTRINQDTYFSDDL